MPSSLFYFFGKDLHDELLVLLPFEVDLFTRAGVNATFVGHPALEEWTPTDDPRRVRAPNEETVPRHALCLLPGSRQQEVAANLPVMLAAVERIS